MPNGSSAPHEASDRASVASAVLRSDLRAILDTDRSYGESADVSSDLVLGLLAGLLIAKWAAHDDSEREALAAFDEQTFAPGLPNALGLSAWDAPSSNHADAIAEALRGMTTGNGTESAAARYVTHVAPLVIRAVESSRQTYERLLGWIRQLDLGTPEGQTLAAHLFDDVLRMMLDERGKRIGEFVTPEPVAALMLSLANPKSGDRIYDPCFGLGELLVGATRRLSEAAWFASPQHRADVQAAEVFGVEINRVAHAVGLCRALLAGVDRPGFELGDALERPLPRGRSADGFDCILAAPPWGGRIKHPSADRFPFPSRNTESLFLQHVMANLRPGGRAVVVLPESALFRTGDRRLRKALLSEYSVDAVVSLPDGAFAPWTGVAASLVVFRRTKSRPTVRFVSISPKAWEEKTGDDSGDQIRDEDRSESDDAVAYGHGFPDGGAARGGAGQAVAKSGEGVGSGKRRVPRFELLWLLPDLLRSRHAVLAGPFLPGVEAWEVPVSELAQRDYELVAKKSGSEALDAELERLAALDPALKVERLERVTEICPGLSYARRFTTRNSEANDIVGDLLRAGDVGQRVEREQRRHIAAGLLRAGDVKDTVVSPWESGALPPTLFLTEDGKGRLREKDYLRPLDIVVTTSGTVGKVALFPTTSIQIEAVPGLAPTDGSKGFIAHGWVPLTPVVATRSLAVARAGERVEPEFLAALLRSPVYRNWLSGHARGTAIQHLPIRTLRKLPVPVPPLEVQIAVCDEFARSGGDAMAVLVRLLSRTANEPVAVWLETPLVARLVLGIVDGEYARGMRGLVAAADALRSLIDRTRHLPDPDSLESGDLWFRAWLEGAREAAAALDGVASVPRGAGRLAILGVALSRLREALHMIDGVEGSTVGRLNNFTRMMIRFAEEEVRAMQESITLDVGVEPAEVVVGAVSEVRLRLTNSSSVPLRNLRVETRPAVGTGRISYLSDGGTHDIPLTIRPRAGTQPLHIAVSWQASRLDGATVRGEAEVSLRVLSTREAVRSGDLGASPYIVGSPVERQEMFFGRASVIDRIRRQLGASKHTNVILLEGNRRTGKTSVLRQLGKVDVLPGWIPVYCSFQDAEGDGAKAGVNTRNVFRLLARRTGWTLGDAGVETWFPDLPDREPGRPFKLAFRAALDRIFADSDAPFEAFEIYIAAAVEAASPRRILLMLDEFDKLQEGIDAGITSPQVPENIRHLLQHQPGLSAIITGSRRLKRLREEYWSALFGLGYRVGISALPLDDARRLVTEPVEGRLGYLPQARDRLVELCACHPFLVQSLCSRVFERAATGGDRTITVDTVEGAATEMVRDNEHFRTLWDYAGTARRRLLLALCDHLAKGPDAVNLDLFSMKLQELGVPLSRDSELEGEVAELRQLELLDLDDSYRRGTYRLSVPLMARWLRMNEDFKALVVRARQEAEARS